MTYIYTDGSCKSNGNAAALGGTGVVILEGENIIHTHHQTYSHTTNNRMEYKSMIYGMKWCIDQNIRNPTFVSDSKLLLDTIQTWMYGWAKKGWKKAGTGESSKIKNLDLVLELWELVPKLQNPSYQWVKGHNGDTYNDMADELTNMIESENAVEDKTNTELLKANNCELKMAARASD